MTVKKKFSISIFFLALTFFMMVDTKYHSALGDYVLRALGLQPWTGSHGGIHLTVLYFGFLFLICLYFFRKYSKAMNNLTPVNKFVIFVLLVAVMATVSGYTAKHMKSNASGLKSIGYVSPDNQLEYRSIDNKIVAFNAYFTLKNYSDDKRTFHISIDSPWARKEKVKAIKIYNLKGNEALFTLAGKEEKTFQINLENYKIEGGKGLAHGGFKGNIDELVLSNREERIYLKDDKVFNLNIIE